eukprot:836191-Rhodomonas_salina.1
MEEGSFAPSSTPWYLYAVHSTEPARNVCVRHTELALVCTREPSLSYTAPAPSSTRLKPTPYALPTRSPCMGIAIFPYATPDINDSTDSAYRPTRSLRDVQYFPTRCPVEDPETELVEPAVKGTMNILRTARKVGGIRRVIVTSSQVPSSLSLCYAQLWGVGRWGVLGYGV